MIIIILIVVIFCFCFILIVIDIMVNFVAGLVSKYLGKDKCIIVINFSINNLELFLMLLLLSFRRLGGIVIFLGLNFVNIYFMFIVVLIIVIVKWILIGKIFYIKNFIGIFNKEKMLFLWYFFMLLFMFVFVIIVYWCIIG